MSEINNLNLFGTNYDIVDDSALHEVPMASANTLGGIKVGSNVSITNGVLSADVATTDITSLQAEDIDLQSQIDAITAGSDVKDIVGTKADLNNYDTTTLGNNDIIKVLQDESQNNATTYYRWSTSTSTFTLIGSEGPYYTKAATDTLLNDKSDKSTTYTKTETNTLLGAKQDTLIAGTNVQIAADGKTISATDTTYSAFIGTDGQTAGSAGLVPAPAIADVDKFLKADGSWTGVPDGIKTLTTADYDWPTGSPTMVDKNALTDGVYLVGEQITVRSNAYSVPQTFSVGGIIIKSGGSFLEHESGLNPWHWQSSFVDVSKYNLLDVGNIVNNLTSTDGAKPLSANQGKVLNERIGNLSSLTTTNKTSAVVAINELNADIDNIQALSGTGVPSSSITGTVGQFYVDNSTGDIYYLSAIDETTTPTTYTWKKVAAGSAIPTKTSDLSNDGSDGTSTYVETDELATVATSGSYNDLSDKPTQRQSDWTQFNTAQVDYIKNVPRTLKTIYGTGTAASPWVLLSDTERGDGDEAANYIRAIPLSNDNISAAYAGVYINDVDTIRQFEGRLTLYSDLENRILQNASTPTTSTVGTVGQLLEDTTNGKLYQCTAVSGNTYTWTEIGNGPTVVQTTGTSTTDVMSQNAVTGMIYADPGAKLRVQIGGSAGDDGGNNVVAIKGTVEGGSGTSAAIAGTIRGSSRYSFAASGGEVKANSAGAIAIGQSATAQGIGTIALGRGAKATTQGQFDVGTINSNGYNNSNYRLLTGLYDPQSDHDAATKGYVDANSASVFTTNEWNALWA